MSLELDSGRGQSPSKREAGVVDKTRLDISSGAAALMTLEREAAEFAISGDHFLHLISPHAHA